MLVVSRIIKTKVGVSRSPWGEPRILLGRAFMGGNLNPYLIYIMTCGDTYCTRSLHRERRLGWPGTEIRNKNLESGAIQYSQELLGLRYHTPLSFGCLGSIPVGEGVNFSVSLKQRL